ncbi:MAG TPA: MFS transporter [Xanthobacteraceae bacterium]|nr:MFS transporter [Xanthobacteraceae bacterium]
MDQIHAQEAASAAELIAARLDRLPVSSWHIRVRLILGIATFFDAFDLLAISFALPAIAGPWQLSPQQIGMVISAAFAGQLVGALTAGWAAEMFGRLRTVVIATALFGVMSLACAFAWDAQSLTAFRFIQGIGLGGEVPVATAYIIELARERGRGRFYILYELVFVFGLVIAGLLGYVMVPRFGWQSMFYLGALPAILAVFLTRLLPESPRWLAGQDRVAEADEIVGHIEQQIEASGKKLSPVQLPAPLAVAPTPAGPLRRRWFEMLDGAYRRRTLGVWAMWFCCFSTIYGLNTWMPTPPVVYRGALRRRRHASDARGTRGRERDTAARLRLDRQLLHVGRGDRTQSLHRRDLSNPNPRFCQQHRRRLAAHRRGDRADGRGLSFDRLGIGRGVRLFRHYRDRRRRHCRALHGGDKRTVA